MRLAPVWTTIFRLVRAADTGVYRLLDRLCDDLHRILFLAPPRVLKRAEARIRRRTGR